MYNPYAYINHNGHPQQGNDPYAGAGYHANQHAGYYPMNDAYGRLGYMRYNPSGTLPKGLQTEHQGYTSFPPHPLGQQGYAPQGYPSYHGGYLGGYPGYHGNGQYPPMNFTGDHGNPPYALQQQYIQQARAQEASAQHYRTQQHLPQQLHQPTPPAGEKGFGASVFRAAGAGNVGNDYSNLSSAQSQHSQQLDPSAASYNPQSQLSAQAPQGTKRGFGSMISEAGGKLFGTDHGKPAYPQQYQPQYQPQPHLQQQPQQGESAAYYNAQPQQPMPAPAPAAPGTQKGLGSSMLGASGGGLMSSTLGAGMLGTAGGALAGAAGMNMAHKLHKKHRSHSHHRRSAPSSGSSSSSSSSNSSGSSS